MAIVSKFGGTSLADAKQVRKVLDIVKSDPKREYIVVSAPGRRSPKDPKVTDLLYEWQRLAQLNIPSDEIRKLITARYAEIIKGLGLTFDLDSAMGEIAREIENGASADYAASRGEYLNGKLLAEALGYDFVDPATCIHFDAQGRLSERDDKLAKALAGRRAVIPGFYGSRRGGIIKTFSRGGSDVTGAVVARAVKAEMYENWTDVSGLLMTDPRIVKNPKRIPSVTYRELRELAYMGANVFHEEAMFPVMQAHIPTHILNTNEPDDGGTIVVPDNGKSSGKSPVTGLAGRRGFTALTVEKSMLRQEVGFVRKLLRVLESNQVSFEHIPSGIDSVTLIVDGAQLEGKGEKVIEDIKKECSPEIVETQSDLALVAVVGRGMAKTPGMAASIFGAVAKAGVNVRMINQGSSEISIIFGVDDEDYEKAVRAVYAAFVA
jgi:aspartate kinase